MNKLLESIKRFAGAMGYKLEYTLTKVKEPDRMEALNYLPETYRDIIDLVNGPLGE